MNRAEHYRDEDKRKRTNRLQKRRYRARTGSGYGQHQWTQAEEDRVVAHEVPDKDLAVALGVSVQAISVKRHRLLANQHRSE